jgi:hypothetical protein
MDLLALTEYNSEYLVIAVSAAATWLYPIPEKSPEECVKHNNLLIIDVRSVHRQF